MRYWAEAFCKFISFAFKPLRHIESLWGWAELVMMWLLLIGIIATPVIGSCVEWTHWPLLTVSLIAVLFLSAGVRLQYTLLRSRFYLGFSKIHWKLLALPPKPFKGSTSFKLTISNQGDKPRGVSKIMLEIQLENGYKKVLHPMQNDNETEADVTLYLQPHEPKTVPLNFVYDTKPIKEMLYIFDDKGAWCRVPINVDTMAEMSKKSKSRSGEYQIE